MNKINFYIHVFSFHVHVSQEMIKYVVHNIATISEENYTNILLGQCLKNMGIIYQAEDSVNYQKIFNDLQNPNLKVGRFKTRNPTITKEEIQLTLQNLGYNLASIYVTEKEADFLLKMFSN